jgi:hypothetical protein
MERRSGRQSIYQTVQTKTKSKFLGLSTGTRLRFPTRLTGMDDAMEQQISLLIASLRSGIVSAAGTIGIDGAAAMVDAFQLNLGRISFKDLSGEEIEKELQADSPRRPTRWRRARSVGSPPSRKSAKACSRR